jgi:hypothetical protein
MDTPPAVHVLIGQQARIDTQIQRLIEKRCFKSCTISSKVALSKRFPKDAKRHRKPRSVTTKPITICLQSPRLSRE